MAQIEDQAIASEVLRSLPITKTSSRLTPSNILANHAPTLHATSNFGGELNSEKVTYGRIRDRSCDFINKTNPIDRSTTDDDSKMVQNTSHTRSVSVALRPRVINTPSSAE